MKRSDSFYLRKIDNIFFLYPSDDLEEDEKKMVILNESSAFLWEKMTESFTADELVNALLDRYNVSDEIARQHVTEFISFLSENGCLSN